MIFDGPDDERFILMGQGSVAVRAADCQAGARVDFRECAEVPVGTWLTKEQATETGPPRVALIFANVEAVDVVIRALQVARERIEKKTAARTPQGEAGEGRDGGKEGG